MYIKNVLNETKQNALLNDFLFDAGWHYSQLSAPTVSINRQQVQIVVALFIGQHLTHNLPESRDFSLR